MILCVIIWLLKSVVILGIFHFLLPTLANATTRNRLIKLPVMLVLAILAGIFMAWLKYVPYLLFLLWIVLTKYSLSAMTEEKFESEAGMQINKPLFYISSYLYVVLACVSALFLQTESCVGDMCIPLWKYLLNIE